MPCRCNDVGQPDTSEVIEPHKSAQVTFSEGITLLDPKLLDGKFGEFLRIPLASLTNLDNLLCDKLRDRIASFDQVELTQRVLIGFGQYRYFFRPPRKGFEYAIDRRSSFFPPAERCNKSQTAQHGT